MKNPIVLFVMLLLVACGRKEEALVMPRAWQLVATPDAGYTAGIAEQGVVTINAPEEADSSTYGALMQRFEAGKFRGQRVRLSAEIKSEPGSGWSGLWMRTDPQDADGTPLSPHSHAAVSEPAASDNNWHMLHVVMHIPDSANTIAIGVMLGGSGRLWVKNLKFETVGADVALSPLHPVVDGASHVTDDDTADASLTSYQLRQKYIGRRSLNCHVPETFAPWPVEKQPENPGFAE